MLVAARNHEIQFPLRLLAIFDYIRVVVAASVRPVDECGLARSLWSGRSVMDPIVIRD